jgi:hypothetical protein
MQCVANPTNRHPHPPRQHRELRPGAVLDVSEFQAYEDLGVLAAAGITHPGEDGPADTGDLDCAG